MRRLLLLRHSKAERSQPGGSDHDRVLTERGRADARKLGGYMSRHGLQPDLALVSSSARTRETWSQASAALGKTPPVRLEKLVYEAVPEDMLRAIQETDSSVRTLLVVGHNPGLQELAVMLVAAGDVEARQRLNEEFPTSALAVIDFAIEDWSQLHRHAGRLEHFIVPRSLQAATD